MDERARTSAMEEQEKKTWDTSSVARSSNSILAVRDADLKF